ncbi:adenylate cyclase [Sinorhizobium terangae]|nr:adenylate cyclase [Sinorhizobium terangae]
MILLRFVAFAILLANLLLAGNEEGEGARLVVVVSYFIISVAAITTARYIPGRSRLKTLFVVLDALLVALILYGHILTEPVARNHNLTTTSLVVAFILLVHVGLKLDRRLVLVFSTIVLIAWVSMLVITAVRHHNTADAVSRLASLLNQDLGLTVSFGFTSFAIYLFARDHDRTRKEALKADQRRLNLSRFFSPLIVSELQERGEALGLERRNAAIMFVDLRDFTSFAETVPARELASVLAEYRQLVSHTIFGYGGTVDKFIGDGVMAVFGQPRPTEDDADRALACALELVEALNEWRDHGVRNGYRALDAAIGLHFGAVVGGVLDSGCHSEFTVIGDAVNVAQRLETLAKSLDSPLVVSSELLARLRKTVPCAIWFPKNGVSLPGRRLPIDIWYLRRESGVAGTSDPDYDTGRVHTAF